MRKIDLNNYNTELTTPDGKHVPVVVRKSLVDVLFLRPCNGRDILLRERLATKIDLWPDEDLLLEDAEWKQLVDGLDACQFTNRGFVEFARRVLEAPDVAVQAKQ